MRYFIAGTALMLAASPVAAQGFNPFGSLHTTTGAYMTTPGGSVTARTWPERSAAMTRETRANMQGEPAERSSFPSLTSPPTLYSPDGGPQPAISGSTPPLVSFRSSYGAGNIVIDSGGRSLYYVVSSTQAYRYPVAVGREGFSWTGVEKVSRKAQWPDWHSQQIRNRSQNAKAQNQGYCQSTGSGEPSGNTVQTYSMYWQPTIQYTNPVR